PDSSRSNPIPFTESGIRPVLDDRLRRLWHTGQRTRGGRTYYPSSEFAHRLYAYAVPAKKNLYKFEAHGSLDRALIGDEPLSVEDVAQLIEADRRFTGQPVWLLACTTGRLRHGFAAALAVRLGVDVIAPTNEVVISPFGEVRVTNGRT